MMQNVSWDAIYNDGSDWYDNFINLVYTKFQQSFPLVRLSRKRAKDKPWITQGIKISIKVKHCLYKLSLRNSDPGAIKNILITKNILRTCIKNSDSLYQRELFENTKISAYNLWKHLGPIINNKKKNAAI